jgi:hypothetical protein
MVSCAEQSFELIYVLNVESAAEEKALNSEKGKER